MVWKLIVSCSCTDINISVCWLEKTWIYYTHEKNHLPSSTMGRRGPESVLEAYQHLLWFWYIHQNLSLDNTRNLFRQHNPHLEIYQHTPDYPSMSTLVRAFKRWNFRKYNKPYDSDSLNKELWVYFLSLVSQRYRDSEFSLSTWLSYDSTQVYIMKHHSFICICSGNDNMLISG